ncbi:MAG: ABC transporter ATP-binding protein [Spirochaetota bacterium]|nr:ABC transporter ATP-binding protein [Spirochaetota bacterium]
MPNIRLENINNFICRDINLEIRDREFLVIWGPTGAGKTTLLNIIAGLIKYQGSVLFDSYPVDKLPVNMRSVGYLFQNLVLFPHLNVSSNIAYGLRIQGKPRNEIEARVSELLRMMEMDHLAKRFPKDLSGGEKQRVALARAIAPSPEIMLLDEPLNSLDYNTAGYLMNEIHRIHKEMGTTTVYITHCYEEAFSLADRVVTLKRGRIIRSDLPCNVFKKVTCGQTSEGIACDCHQENNKYGLFYVESDKNCVLCHSENIEEANILEYTPEVSKL